MLSSSFFYRALSSLITATKASRFEVGHETNCFNFCLIFTMFFRQSISPPKSVRRNKTSLCCVRSLTLESQLLFGIRKWRYIIFYTSLELTINRLMLIFWLTDLLYRAASSAACESERQYSIEGIVDCRVHGAMRWRVWDVDRGWWHSCPGTSAYFFLICFCFCVV